MAPAKIGFNGYTALVSLSSVLFFSSEPALQLSADLAGFGARALVVAAPAVVAPPDPRAWSRAVSELALFNWLLLPTPAAAQALIEAIGAPPGRTVRIATVSAASAVLRAEGRVPDVEAESLGTVLEVMSGRIGRRQRALVPHATVAGRRVGRWLEALGAEAVCRAAYDFDLTETGSLEKPMASVVTNPTEVEILASLIGAGRLPGTSPIAVFGRGAADAAEDCGLGGVLVAEFPTAGRLGPFLNETLS